MGKKFCGQIEMSLCRKPHKFGVWGALKSVNDSVSSVNDKEIIDIMERACEMFDDNLNTVLDILGGISYE